MISRQMIEEQHRECEEAKTKLPEGPWTKEPNRVEFQFEGLQCLLLRVPFSLHWCGYVAVPKFHRAFGCGYDDELVSGVDVHGGLTYANACNGNICHITDGLDELHWFGFDCAHFGDLMPLTAARLQRAGLAPELKSLVESCPEMKREFREHYWTMEEVAKEVRGLATQLKAIGAEE